jgi:hypothetical protein
MATGATGQLGLALPVQGELSGTWGDTVNNGITQYTNLAIAATLTLTGDGAVTLANTTGDATASNITSTLAGAGTVTAQHAVVRVSGTLTTTKVITAPSYSKTYILINDATGGSVTIKASGQTGITVAVGDKALVAYNGTDYVRVGASAGGSTTQVQYNSSGNLAGSANLTFDGTTLTAANFADSSLTAGRVTYAGASGNLTDSANLVWDNTNARLGIGTASPAIALQVVGDAGGSTFKLLANTTVSGSDATIFRPADNTLSFSTNGAERFRFGSAGQFGIGGATYGTAGQVLTSGGPSAAPTWSTASGGGSSTGANLYLAVNFGGF